MRRAADVDLVGRPEPEADAAHLRLVADVRRYELDRDRESRCRSATVPASSDVRASPAAGVPMPWASSSADKDGIPCRPSSSPRRIASTWARPRRRRDHVAAMSAALPEHGHAGDRPHCALGERVAWHARILEATDSRHHPGAAHEGRDHGNRPASRGGRHRPSDPQGLGGGLGRQDHEGGIRAVRAGGAKGRGVPGGIGVAHEVDGIRGARRRRQRLGEPGAYHGVERRDLEPALVGGVGRDDAEAAAIRHDEQPAAARQRLHGKAAGQVEQLLDAPSADRARLRDGRVEGLIRAGQRPRVRGDGARALGRAARLQHHHGLGRRGSAERGEESRSVRDTLQVGDDDARLDVVRHGLQHVGLREVRLVAEAREDGEPEVPVARPVEDRHGQRTRVRDERDRSSCRHAGRERHVQARRGPDPAETVRAEHADGMVGQPGPQLRLAIAAGRVALAKPGRDDDGDADALGRAVLERGQHARGGDGDDGKVDRAGHVQDRARGRQALDLVGRRALMGMRRPANPADRKLAITLPPTLAGSREAPITATLRGSNSAASPSLLIEVRARDGSQRSDARYAASAVISAPRSSSRGMCAVGRCAAGSRSHVSRYVLSCVAPMVERSLAIGVPILPTV